MSVERQGLRHIQMIVDQGREGISMGTDSPIRRFTILAADRNPHVRDFLKREMMAEGFQVNVAKSGQEVLEQVYQNESIDLVILDPDMPDMSSEELLAQVSDRIPHLPLIIHSLSSDDASQARGLLDAAFVEKEGGSIEALKTIVIEILTRTRRLASGNSSQALP